MGPPRTLTENSQGVTTTKLYLLIYNGAQTIGWTIILLQLCMYYIFSSNEENNSLYHSVKWPLIISQSSAVLEIINALLGITPSNPLITSLQVSVRIPFICGILPYAVGAQNCSGFPIALLAWSVTEIIRYLYYALNQVNMMVPYFLMWLRYSTFIVLYPIGFVSEWICFNEAHKKFAETGLFDHKPANALTIVLLVLPIAIVLYKHMLIQRSKVLGVPASFNDIKTK